MLKSACVGIHQLLHS